MPLTVQEKYQRLKEKLKDPVFYSEYRKKCLERQRRYARDPEYCRKRALSTADWRWRKNRGLPTRFKSKLRPHILSIPKPEPQPASYEFTLVSEIAVSFD